MRTGTLSLLVAALVVFGGSGGTRDAAAQIRRLGRPGVPATFYLTAKPVQDELKMSPEQVREARDAHEKVSEAQVAIQSGPAEEGDKRWRQLLAESEKTAAGILNPDQLKRLRQIRLQHAGALALSDPTFAAELKLTEAQRKAIRAAAEDREAKAKKVVFDRDLTNRQVAAKLTELTKAAEAAILKQLTAEQRAKWAAMLGKPFRWPTR